VTLCPPCLTRFFTIPVPIIPSPKNPTLRWVPFSEDLSEIIVLAESVSLKSYTLLPCIKDRPVTERMSLDEHAHQEHGLVLREASLLGMLSILVLVPTIEIFHI